MLFASKICLIKPRRIHETFGTCMCVSTHVAHEQILQSVRLWVVFQRRSKQHFFFFKYIIELVISSTRSGNCFSSWRSFGLHLALILLLLLLLFPPFIGLWWGVFVWSGYSYGQTNSALCWRWGKSHLLRSNCVKSKVCRRSCSICSLSVFQACASAHTSPRGRPVSAAWTVTMESLWLARLVIVSLALAQTEAAVPKLQGRDRWSVPTALEDRQVKWCVWPLMPPHKQLYISMFYIQPSLRAHWL